MLRGEKRGFFGLTEPSGGSDPARAIRTRAVRDGSDWIINGSKVFISGADKADFGLVFARTDADKGRGGITCFIVDTDMKGFHVRRVVHTLRSSHYATELQFEDLRVPHANVLGEVGRGFAIANDRLSRQRIPYAAACIGVAVKAQEMAIDYAKQRETFGAPLATRQAVQWMIVDNEIDIRTSLWLTLGRRPQGRARRALPHGGRHGQAGRQRGRRARGRPRHADPWRLRHDQGPAVRALVSRDAHPPGRRGAQRGAAPRRLRAICWGVGCDEAVRHPPLPAGGERGPPYSSLMLAALISSALRAVSSIPGAWSSPPASAIGTTDADRAHPRLHLVGLGDLDDLGIELLPTISLGVPAGAWMRVPDGHVGVRDSRARSASAHRGIPDARSV